MRFQCQLNLLCVTLLQQPKLFPARLCFFRGKPYGITSLVGPPFFVSHFPSDIMLSCWCVATLSCQWFSFVPLKFFWDEPWGMICPMGLPTFTLIFCYSTIKSLTHHDALSSQNPSLCTFQTFQGHTCKIMSCWHHQCHMAPLKWWHMSTGFGPLSHPKMSNIPTMCLVH